MSLISATTSSFSGSGDYIKIGNIYILDNTITNCCAKVKLEQKRPKK
jgi:hypothetical protein